MNSKVSVKVAVLSPSLVQPYFLLDKIPLINPIIELEKTVQWFENLLMYLQKGNLPK